MNLSATQRSHELIRQYWQTGDAIDATAGNGHDTLFLLQNRPTQSSRVFACDIQEAAIHATGALLHANSLAKQATLIQCDHAQLLDKLPEDIQPGAVIYNLGYLPHGDHSITTEAASTLASIRHMNAKLLPGGIVVVVYYTGHPGGAEEADAVIQFVHALDREEYDIWHEPGSSERKHPPGIAAFRRKTRNGQTP